MTELYHHGVKGMKWGVRRYRTKDSKRRAGENEDAKKHLGIDSKGNISFTSDMTRKNVTKFVAKTAIFASTISLSVYIAKHPEIVSKGARKVDDMLNKNGSKTFSSVKKDLNDSGLFSKSLGRNLTIDEAIARGLGEYITRR